MKPDLLKIEPLTGGKPVSAEKVNNLNKIKIYIWLDTMKVKWEDMILPTTFKRFWLQTKIFQSFQDYLAEWLPLI